MSRRTRIALGAAAALLATLVAAVGAVFAGGLEYAVPHDPRPCDHLLQGPPVVAHRGYSARAPENTLSAFRMAASLGVPMELDVTLARSGEVVVIHDDDLDRTTTGTGPVADADLATLRTLDAGSWFDPSFAGEPLPTLDQVLEAIDGRVVIDIELKTTEARQALAQGVVDAVRARGQQDRVFVSSFDPYLLEQVRLLEPSIRRGQLIGTFRDSDLAPWEKTALQSLALNGAAQPDLVIGGDDFVSASWVARQKGRGYTVMVYTINDPERMRELRDWGVDAVITDEPELALQTLGNGSPTLATPPPPH